jgi:hypothetical protein
MSSSLKSACIKLDGATLLDAFHDANVSHDCIAQQLVRRLVSGTLVSSYGASDAVELNDDSALVHACFKGLCWHSPNQVASARIPDRRSRQFRVLNKSVGVPDLSVARY